MAAFQNRCLQQGESVEEFAYHLRRLLSDAMPNLTDDDAKTTMLAQQFVAGLPPPIRQKILETTEDVTLPKAISTAKRLLALQQPATLAPVGTTPYEELTTALAKQMDVTAALAKQIETVTNKLESLSMDAAERQQRSRVKTFFGNCWNCGKQGHVSARCLEPRCSSASGSDDGSQK